MLKQPVAAALHFLYKYCVLLILTAMASSSYAEPVRLVEAGAEASAEDSRYLAKIELHTVKEFHEALKKAESLSGEHTLDTPVAFVLHGSEAEVLLTEKYKEYQEIVDLASQLSQKSVVEIQVCRTWMFFHGLDSDDFAPFVGTVRYAPSEIRRLISKKGYTYF